jgi:hypothetical protein
MGSLQMGSQQIVLNEFAIPSTQLKFVSRCLFVSNVSLI